MRIGFLMPLICFAFVAFYGATAEAKRRRGGAK